MFDVNKKYLYHYTSFEAAVKIISSGKLLFSVLTRLNDINESCGPSLLARGTTKETQEAMKLLQRYKTLSFASDNKVVRGYDIPTMWGHYASRGSGACLVFEKESLLTIMRHNHFYNNYVKYLRNVDSNDYYYNPILHGDAQNFVHKAIKPFFFRKSLDWKYEQEFRCISNNQDSLDYGDSLVAAILYAKTYEEFKDKAETKALEKLLGRDNIYFYKKDILNTKLLDFNNKDVYPPIKMDIALTRKVKENTE